VFGPLKDRLQWTFTGVVVGLHWYFFFESIKVSNVSVALVSLSSTALFTAILEPLFHRKRFQFYELLFSLLIIAGMIMVLSFEFHYALGILYGVLCAFLASTFTVLNSRFIAKERASLISFYELAGGFCFITLITLIMNPKMIFVNLPNWKDSLYLLLLGVFATAIAFVVAVAVMKKLSAFTVSLTINLEPLYGILLAVIIFGEEELMSAGFYLGFILILGTILCNAYLKARVLPAA
jgi:drug/metabolite transporter (DMT)-like permease